MCIKFNREDPTQNQYRLSIPGSPLGDLSPDNLAKFGRALYEYGCTATRFDWAIDDYDRQLSVDSFEEKGKLGDYSGAREFGVYYKRRLGQLNDAKTVYFGSYASDKLIRIYDKNIESKGKINAIRFEGQFRNELSKVYFNTLFGDTKFSANAQIVSNYAIGSIRFIRRTNAVVSRCEEYADWRTFCERVGQAIKISAKRIMRTVEQKMKWVERQVAGTLALCALCIGLEETMAWLERHIRVKVRRISQGSNEFFKSYRDRIIVESLGYDESVKLKRSKKNVDRNQLELKICQDH
jgi:DNA relaxase NicK